MFPAAALGELLVVGAVPAAALVAIVAAILARRHRRPARVLMGMAAVVLVGMLVAGRRLSAPFDDVRERQLARFAPLAVGRTAAEVEAVLGAPDLRCPGHGAHSHRVRGTPELLARLLAATAERWIYFLPGAATDQDSADHDACEPRYGDGVVALDAGGRVIWYLELTDETFLNF
jgi:hypothetical protein